MPIRALYWDVGGVLLSNAWDHEERARTLKQFHLDEADFQSRHEPLVSSFECGQISLDEYLDRTVFYRERPFPKAQFRDYIFSLSQPKSDVLAFARSLAASGRLLMSTLNNESRELNLYRIGKFEMREIFRIFVSSCFVGLRKPEKEIYRLALDITQVAPEDCCFIDDRAENLDPAATLGMKTIRMQSLEQLRSALSELGVKT